MKKTTVFWIIGGIIIFLGIKYLLNNKNEPQTEHVPDDSELPQRRI